MNIAAYEASQGALNPALFTSMFRLRHEMFKERLNWEVNSVNGLEMDEFDEMDPYYLIASDKDSCVNGCWRLLPTTGDYMLEKIFPELLRGETAPKDDAIWEISRVSVRPGASKCRQKYATLTLMEMLRESYYFARLHNIRTYITETSLAVERLLRSLDLPLERFGDGKSTRIGNVDTVAIKMDVTKQLQSIVREK